MWNMKQINILHLTLKKNLHCVEIMLVKLSFGQIKKQKGTALNSFTIVKIFTIKLSKNYTTFIHDFYIFRGTSHHNCRNVPSYQFLCYNTAHYYE